ncbi:MAG: hypothetical protein ACPG61_07125, partial [Paracoccaceae bacterium]
MLDGLTSRFAAGLRSPLGGVVVPGVVIPTVTVTRAPSLVDPIAVGDTLADGLDAGAYTAPAGGSIGVLEADWEVDGSIVGGTPTQAEDDVLRARITVNYTDGEAVARSQVFWTNAVTVTAVAGTTEWIVTDNGDETVTFTPPAARPTYSATVTDHGDGTVT